MNIISNWWRYNSFKIIGVLHLHLPHSAHIFTHCLYQISIKPTTCHLYIKVISQDDAFIDNKKEQ